MISQPDFLLFRFATLEAAEVWMTTQDPKLLLPPYVVDEDQTRVNPAYVDAPFELAVWSPQTGSKVIRSEQELLDFATEAAIVAPVTPESRSTASHYE